MLKQIKAWFMGLSTPPHHLEKPSQMQVGDLMTLDDHFALPPELRGQSFRVKRISSYEYDYGIFPGFVMESAQRERVFLTVDEDDDITLEFSLKLSHKQVLALFPEGTIAHILSQEQTSVSIEPGKLAQSLQQWLSTDYERREKPYAFTYYGGQDARAEDFARDYPEKGTSYFLHSRDKEKAIEMEDWGDGEVEVCVVLLVDPKHIKSLWVGDDT